MLITASIVSVIIPCYNYDKYLVEAVNSILLQKVKPEVILETIIVDDCSTDKSLLIAQEIAKRFESVKVIHNEVNKKLTYLSNHPEVRRKVGIRNREFVEKYLSWKVTQPLWDDFFEKVYLGDNQSIVNFPNYMDNFR